MPLFRIMLFPIWRVSHTLLLLIVCFNWDTLIYFQTSPLHFDYPLLKIFYYKCFTFGQLGSIQERDIGWRLRTRLPCSFHKCSIIHSETIKNIDNVRLKIILSHHCQMRAFPVRNKNSLSRLMVLKQARVFCTHTS